MEGDAGRTTYRDVGRTGCTVASASIACTGLYRHMLVELTDECFEQQVMEQYGG